MIKDKSEVISDVLDLDHDNLTPLVEVTDEPDARLPALLQQDKNDPDDKKLETDVDFIRGNLYDAINKGYSSLDELIVIAAQSQQPRAYEVIVNMLKTLADVNESLLVIHEKKKNIKNKGNNNNPPSSNNGTKINKAVFIGSTSDLASFIEKQQNNGRNTIDHG